MNASRQILAILTLTALMCGVWTAALRVLPQPSLAETNYEANRLRVERWLLGPPSPAVLVGTSLTGRLLPGYFQDTPLAGTENLGLDGASPDTGLRLVLMRNPAPALVLLEVHLLSKKPGPNDRQLLDLATGVGLQVSSILPLTRADARPSTVLYGWLKERQAGEGSTDVTPRAVSPEQARKEAEAMDPDWQPRLRELVAQLQARGSQVALVRLPIGRGNPTDPESPNEADATARELGLPLLDLLRISRRDGLRITYTDGLHLTPSSARTVCRLLVGALETGGLLQKPQ